MQEIVNYQINTVVLCDNAPTHTAEATITKIEELEIYTIFISPYSPAFALVELLFNMIKSKVKATSIKDRIYLGENLEKNEFTMYYEPYHPKWLEDTGNL